MVAVNTFKIHIDATDKFLESLAFEETLKLYLIDYLPLPALTAMLEIVEKSPYRDYCDIHTTADFAMATLNEKVRFLFRVSWIVVVQEHDPHCLEMLIKGLMKYENERKQNEIV